MFLLYEPLGVPQFSTDWFAGMSIEERVVRESMKAMQKIKGRVLSKDSKDTAGRRKIASSQKILGALRRHGQLGMKVGYSELSSSHAVLTMLRLSQGLGRGRRFVVLGAA